MLVLLITGVTLKISLGLSYRWGRAERLETQSRWPSDGRAQCKGGSRRMRFAFHFKTSKNTRIEFHR